jgi:glycosyltransferase involved in cell wall biosynthesis
MNVGLLVYGVDRPLTGIARYTIELAEALADRKDAPDITLLQAGSADRLNKRGFRKVPLPGCRLLPGLVTLGNILIPWQARRWNLDLIHDPTGVAPFLFAGDSAKRILTLHDVFPWSCPGTSPLLENIIYRYWLPRMVRRADVILTPSEHSKADISRHLRVPKDRVHVFPYGIAAAFRPLPAEEVRSRLRRRFSLSSPYILYAGALSVRKNVRRLLQAFAAVRREFPDLRLVLAGQRTGKRTPIDSDILREGLTDKIIVTGPVSDAELTDLYNGCLLFVFPSLYEGFGLPPLEAMACGAPVICSDRASLPEVVGDAAVLVDPTDGAALKTAMRELLMREDLRARMREAGLRRSRTFTWERYASDTLEVYRRILSS